MTSNGQRVSGGSIGISSMAIHHARVYSQLSEIGLAGFADADCIRTTGDVREIERQLDLAGILTDMEAAYERGLGGVVLATFHDSFSTIGGG